MTGFWADPRDRHAGSRTPRPHRAADRGAGGRGQRPYRARLWPHPAVGLAQLPRPGSLGAGALLEDRSRSAASSCRSPAAQAHRARSPPCCCPPDRAVPRRRPRSQPIRLAPGLAARQCRELPSPSRWRRASARPATASSMPSARSDLRSPSGCSKFVIGLLWAASVHGGGRRCSPSPTASTSAFGSVRLIMLGTGLATLRWVVTGARPAARQASCSSCRRCMPGSFGLAHLRHHALHPASACPPRCATPRRGSVSVASSGVLLSGTMWASGALYAGLGGGAFLRHGR